MMLLNILPNYVGSLISLHHYSIIKRKYICHNIIAQILLFIFRLEFQ